MKTNKIKLNTTQLKQMIRESINEVKSEMQADRMLENSIQRHLRKALREAQGDFSSSFEQGRNDFYKNKPHGMFGMELKNPEGEWEYGNIDFNPNTMQLSCMGATITVDDDWTFDAALEALYDELMQQGYYSE